MKRSMIGMLGAWAIFGAAAVAPRPSLADPGFFTVTNLGTLGGSETFAAGVNASGQVVGESQRVNPSADRAFRTSPGAAISPSNDLGTLGTGLNSRAAGINASGQVTGSSEINPTTPSGDDATTHAFRVTGTTMTDLGTLGGSNSAGTAINASGQVVGSSDTAGNTQSHAFRTTAGGTIVAGSDLGTLGGTFSQAFGINDSGQAVGYAETAGGLLHAFRTTATGAIVAGSDLGTLGGTFSQALGINASGQAVGYAETAGGLLHAFRTTATGAIVAGSDLGTLGGTFSEAFAINASGHVVGTSETSTAGVFHAFIFDGTAMFDLNSRLLGSTGGIVLTDALGINDSGQVVALGRGSDGFTRSFLLGPAAVPEPGTLALLGIGSGGLLVYLRGRRRAVAIG